MDDLLNNIPRIHLPSNLKAQLRKRYDEHAMEYATEKLHENVPINACMDKDTIKDIEEELVDACFNALILIHKCSEIGRYASDSHEGLLWSSLIDIWGQLELIRRLED